MSHLLKLSLDTSMFHLMDFGDSRQSAELHRILSHSEDYPSFVKVEILFATLGAGFTDLTHLIRIQPLIIVICRQVSVRAL